MDVEALDINTLESQHKAFLRETLERCQELEAAIADTSGLPELLVNNKVGGFPNLEPGDFSDVAAYREKIQAADSEDFIHSLTKSDSFITDVSNMVNKETNLIKKLTVDPNVNQVTYNQNEYIDYKRAVEKCIGDV